MNSCMYWPGEYAKIELTITVNSGATSATTLVAWSRSPKGNITKYIYPTSPELTITSEGVYNLIFEVREVGEWWVGFEGDGVGAGAEQSSFKVRQGHFE